MKKIFRVIGVFIISHCIVYAGQMGPSPLPEASRLYLTGGLGAVFSNTYTSFTNNSTSVLFPSSIGVGLFYLPTVNWHNDFQNGGDANIALGYRFTHNWRADLEFLYANIGRETYGSYSWVEEDPLSRTVFAQQLANPISQSTNRANNYSLLVNVAYEFKNRTAFIPLVEGGIGVSWLQAIKLWSTTPLIINIPSISLSAFAPAVQQSPSIYGTALGWQFKAGLAYEVNPKFFVLAQYRLFGTTDFKASESKIITFPGNPTLQNFFYVAEHDIKGILTHAIELNILFDLF